MEIAQLVNRSQINKVKSRFFNSSEFRIKKPESKISAFNQTSFSKPVSLNNTINISNEKQNPHPSLDFLQVQPPVYKNQKTNKLPRQSNSFHKNSYASFFRHYSRKNSKNSTLHADFYEPSFQYLKKHEGNLILEKRRQLSSIKRTMFVEKQHFETYKNSQSNSVLNQSLYATNVSWYRKKYLFDGRHTCTAKCSLDCFNQEYQKYIKEKNLELLKNLEFINGRSPNISQRLADKIRSLITKQMASTDFQGQTPKKRKEQMEAIINQIKDILPKQIQKQIIQNQLRAYQNNLSSSIKKPRKSRPLVFIPNFREGSKNLKKSKPKLNKTETKIGSSKTLKEDMNENNPIQIGEAKMRDEQQIKRENEIESEHNNTSFEVRQKGESTSIQLKRYKKKEKLFKQVNFITNKKSTNSTFYQPPTKSLNKKKIQIRKSSKSKKILNQPSSFSSLSLDQNEKCSQVMPTSISNKKIKSRSQKSNRKTQNSKQRASLKKTEEGIGEFSKMNECYKQKIQKCANQPKKKASLQDSIKTGQDWNNFLSITRKYNKQPSSKTIRSSSQRSILDQFKLLLDQNDEIRQKSETVQKQYLVSTKRVRVQRKRTNILRKNALIEEMVLQGDQKIDYSQILNTMSMKLVEQKSMKEMPSRKGLLQDYIQKQDDELIELHWKLQQNKKTIKIAQMIMKKLSLEKLSILQTDSFFTIKRKLKTISQIITKINDPELRLILLKYSNLFIDLMKGNSQTKQVLQASNLEHPTQNYQSFLKNLHKQILKFYELRVPQKEKLETDKIGEENRETKNHHLDIMASVLQHALDKQQATMLDQFPHNSHYLGRINHYTTEKQRKPFDFYHYKGMMEMIIAAKGTGLKHKCKHCYIDENGQLKCYQKSNIKDSHMLSKTNTNEHSISPWSQSVSNKQSEQRARLELIKLDSISRKGIKTDKQQLTEDISNQLFQQGLKCSGKIEQYLYFHADKSDG